MPLHDHFRPPLDKITPPNATSPCLTFPLPALVTRSLTILYPSPAVSSMETSLPTRLLLLQWRALFVPVERMMPLTRHHPSVRVRLHQTIRWIYSTSPTHRSFRSLASVAHPSLLG